MRLLTKIKFPTLASLLLIIGILSLEFFIFPFNQELKGQVLSLTTSSTNPQQLAKEIKVTNLTDTQATIIWNTKTPELSEVIWGDTKNLKNLSIDDRTNFKNTPSLTHYVTLKNLKPNTTYFLKIRSNNAYHPSEPLTFKTLSSQTLSSNSPVIGIILNENLDPIDESLITLDIDTPLATYSTTNGNFLLPLNLIEKFQSSENYSLFISKGNKISSVKLTLPITDPLPPIIIGQNFDFTTKEQTTNILSTTASSSESAKYDFNRDGQVNSIDLGNMLRNLNGSSLLYDLNNDKKVDRKDFEILKSQIN